MHRLAPSGSSLVSWTFSFLLSIIACHSLTRVAPQTTLSPAELRSELASRRPLTRTHRRLSSPPCRDPFTPSSFLFLNYEIYYKEKPDFVNRFFMRKTHRKGGIPLTFFSRYKISLNFSYFSARSRFRLTVKIIYSSEETPASARAHFPANSGRKTYNHTNDRPRREKFYCDNRREQYPSR